MSAFGANNQGGPADTTSNFDNAEVTTQANSNFEEVERST